MNHTLTLAQPAYFYSLQQEIKPNLRKTPLYLEELEVTADEIEVIQELKENWYPFTKLIKVMEEEPERKYFLRGYYLVGEFDLDRLTIAIKNRLMGKRLKHISFSDIPICENMEKICISFDDSRVLVEYGRGTRLIPRK